MSVIKIFVFTLVSLCGTIGIAQDWIPYRTYTTPSPVVYQTEVVYQYIQPVRYEYVPVVVSVPIVVIEHKFLLCKTERVVYVPMVKYEIRQVNY
jgi:hypothetical protein